ncbi:MAG TPA: hypothetical protein VFN52_03350 [Acidiferrobacteraceae bacterium]|nr:hypothetical protein [Acidiferrobacteraceae bacterium]
MLRKKSLPHFIVILYLTLMFLGELPIPSGNSLVHDYHAVF